jgi:hypothetical protein
MFNLNSIPIPENTITSTDVSVDTNEQNFPTNSFKSILQNSDLLELLLKPMASPDEIEREKALNCVNVAGDDYESDFNCLNFDDLLKPSKHFDHDYVDGKFGSHFDKKSDNSILSGNQFDPFFTAPEKLNQTNQNKSYGNAFLGPSLWEKNEIFQNEKFGVEILDIDEFLNENNLNEADMKFLDRLQNNEVQVNKKQTQIETPHVVPKTGSIMDNNMVKVPIYNASNITIKVKGMKKAPVKNYSILEAF